MNAGAIRVAVWGSGRSEARRLQRAARGFDTKVVACIAEPDELADRLRDPGVEVVVLPITLPQARCAEEVRRLRPDVKLVVVDPDGEGEHADARADDLEELPSAIITTFLA